MAGKCKSGRPSGMLAAAARNKYGAKRFAEMGAAGRKVAGSTKKSAKRGA